jgi:predicted DNA-binding transcriptional regulator AlpA
MERLLTLKEFCALARISRATFYRLPDPPRMIHINRRVLIRPADGDAWCAQMAGVRREPAAR